MKPVNALNPLPGVFSLAKKIVLAGDHWQLPPTVLSHEAASLGLNNSILEVAVSTSERIFTY